ncbi:ABC transporter ATP-binding protein [Acidipropionibacterium virtanenii]|uniref:Putative ABC transporter ATP-binding protein YbhF n=1 Tax=Acidipropionibacterium virtanenii TaxID=2057246 RepID=A0A344UV34_9ACTN|nr:ABC transporter ATP-binding protein [Acidipropionibacterium virtanenii]AXE39132.1 putative ABC transporter ATP-binding protein YbhF [Acidipropionibacterium virtanenii]
MQPAEPAIDVKALRKQFGAVRAVEDVTFHVSQGEVFGVLGPNGAGKTTTVECLVGAISRDAGKVSVLGVDPCADRKVIRQSVGYQLQSAVLPPLLTVAEVIAMFAALYANPADASGLMNLIGLDDLARRKVRALSGGQRQRLSIAVALVGNPRIAVLDELTTGLDPQARRDTWGLIADIRGRGVTIVLVTHALDEVDQLCDRLVVIDQGRTRFTGTPSELRDRVASETGHALSLEDAYLRLLDDYSTAFDEERV